MITVMVITESIKSNEMIAASIIGGFENTICIVAASDISESEQIIRAQKHDIDIFIIQIKMKEKGGRKQEQLRPDIFCCGSWHSRGCQSDRTRPH